MSEKAARLRFLVIDIICAVALLLELILCIALPAVPSFDVFFGARDASTPFLVNSALQFALTIVVCVAGLVLCVVGLVAYLKENGTWFLPLVPLMLTDAVLNIVCFVLWALLTDRWAEYAAGLVFTFIAILASFAFALAATAIVLLPTVARPAAGGVKSD